MKRKFFIFLLLAFSFKAYAQLDSTIIEIRTPQQPLIKILDSLELNTSLRFFYYEEWLEKIQVNQEYSGKNLNSVFTEILPKYELFYVTNGSGNIIFSKGENLKLTENKINTETPDTASSEEPLKETTIREKYIKSDNYKDNTVTIGKKRTKDKNAILRGYIKDNESGEPIIGATVYVSELKRGTITDINGYYRISLEPGFYRVNYSAIGYRKLEKRMNFLSTGEYNVNFEKELVALSEVVVKENKYHNIRGMQMGMAQITMRQLKEIPQVGGEKDILKAALLLPGVLSVGESSAGYNVRGGAVDQNQFLINHVPLFNTSHMLGFFSAFNADIIKDFKLYKSNIPIEYGGKISSVFDFQTKNGNQKKFSFKGGISPVAARLAVEGPIIKEKLSYLLGFRGSYSNWILKKVDYENIKESRLSFYDFALNVFADLNDNNKINFFLYNSFDSFKLVNDIKYTYESLGSSLNWRHIFSERLYSNFTAVYSNYSLDVEDNEIPGYANKFVHNLNYVELKAAFTYLPNSRNEFKLGANVINYSIDPGNYTPLTDESIFEQADFENEQSLETSIYASDRFDILDNLSVEGGIRFSKYDYLGPKSIPVYASGQPRNNGTIISIEEYQNNEVIKTYYGWDYRINARYTFDESSSIKLGYSRINQYLFLLTNTTAISPTDRWKLCDSYSEPLIGDQYNIGFYKNFLNSKLETSIELYYKENLHAIDFKNGAELTKNEYIEQSILSGFGKSYGTELMIKKAYGSFTGWMSYTYSRSFLKFKSSHFEETINNGNFYPSNYDKPHSFNLVINFKSDRRLSFSTNITYSTGRPGTFPASKYYIDNNIPVINYSDRNGARIPDYFRTDFSINLEGNLKKKKFAHSFWVLSIYNLTGRRNAYSVYFRMEDQVLKGYKLSVFGTQIVTLSYNIKFGNYASN